VDLLRISIDQYEGDPGGLKLYTGLEDYKTFVDILASLGLAAYQLNYLYGKSSINVESQLFLALVKCRMYKTNA